MICMANDRSSSYDIMIEDVMVTMDQLCVYNFIMIVEFKGDLDKWLKTKGIVHQTSAPYTPQQNGLAERINRTLLERVRAILLASQLPREFWAAAVRVAAVLHNYTPAAHQNLAPHELFHGVPPDTTRLRVFGCKAYAMIPKEKCKKFDARAEQGVFIGYAEDTKAWQVLVWCNHRPVLLETPAVGFFEEQMPDLKELKAMAPATQEDLSNVTFGLVPAGNEEGTGGTRPGCEDGAGDITAGGEGESTGDCEPDEDENAEVQGHSADEDDTRHKTPRYTLRGRNIFDRRGQAHKAAAHDSGWSWDNPTVSEAQQREDWPMWQEAIEEEMRSIAAKQVFDEVKEHEVTRRSLPSRQVLKIKRDA
jgi:hypothetical protein